MTKFSRPFTPRPRTGITSLLLFSLLLFNDRARVLDFMQDACNMRQVFFFFSFSSSSLSLSPSLSLSFLVNHGISRYVLRLILHLIFAPVFPFLFSRASIEKRKKETLSLRNLSRASTTPYILISLRRDRMMRAR